MIFSLPTIGPVTQAASGLDNVASGTGSIDGRHKSLFTEYEKPDFHVVPDTAACSLVRIQETSDQVMTRHLAAPNGPVPCCKSSQQLTITYDCLVSDNFSPQSAHTRLNQGFPEEVTGNKKRQAFLTMQKALLRSVSCSLTKRPDRISRVIFNR